MASCLVDSDGSCVEFLAGMYAAAVCNDDMIQYRDTVLPSCRKEQTAGQGPEDGFVSHCKFPGHDKTT